MLSADVVVIGTGIAGCSAALAAAERGASVALLTRSSRPEESNTLYAQGGIVYTGPEDSPSLLTRDIISASAGTGSGQAARMLAEEGPGLVRELLIERLGVPFDRDPRTGELDLTREGAHSVRRVAHHRDYTGRVIERALVRTVLAEPSIQVLSGTDALELLVVEGRCAGVRALRGGREIVIGASATVLATGGLAALYEHTTNPPLATGDGIALALEAGASVGDLHYVQFHPTTLYVPGGDRFLISESLRGEGAVLRDSEGREFVRHPLGSLAPRDVLAREIWEMMRRTGESCAYLDVSHRPAGWLEERFPTIYERCRAAGIEVPVEPIPVVPAAHYSCGGVDTNVWGRTSLPGLWAAGEVARTGLHGANRLASTSLLEGLVFGWRAGLDATRRPQSPPASESLQGRERQTVNGHKPDRGELSAAWARLRRLMWERAGLARSGEGLRAGLAELDGIGAALDGEGGYEALRLRRALAVARSLLRSALADARSRGCHYRVDCEEAVLADISR